MNNMGQTLFSSNERQQQQLEHNMRIIEQKFRQKYNPTHQMLNLTNCQKQWKDVLQYYESYSRNKMYINEKKQEMESEDYCWRQLRRLELRLCNIDVSTLPNVINYDWPYLTQLNLGQNCIRNKGIRLLLKSKIPNLQILRINWCHIGDEGVKYLRKSLWPNLTQLQLFNNKFKLNGTLSLSDCQWKKISSLNISCVIWNFCVYSHGVAVMNLVCMPTKKCFIINKIQNNQIATDIRSVLAQRFQ